MELISYHSEHGVVSGAIIARGPKYIQVLLVTAPVQIHRLKKTDERYMKLLMYHDKPYPEARFKRKVRRLARIWNGGSVSKGVKQALRA